MGLLRAFLSMAQMPMRTCVGGAQCVWGGGKKGG
jgi:hypothetical protein